MKQTSKVIVGVAVLLLLLVLGGAWFLYSNLDSLVAGVIERQGSKATQTEVEVGSVSIDLQAGTAGISSLAVANPEGFSDQPAITLEDFAIELNPMAVTADPLVVHRIRVNGAHLLVEQDGTENNLRTILASLEQMAPESEPEADGKKLIIDRFELADASAKLLVPQLNEERELKMPQVVLTDIGRATNGATAASIAEQLLAPIIGMALESAAEAGVSDALKDRLDEAEGEVTEGLLDRLRDGGAEDEDENPEPDQ
jgi:hypothetical protein